MTLMFLKEFLSRLAASASRKQIPFRRSTGFVVVGLAAAVLTALTGCGEAIPGAQQKAAQKSDQTRGSPTVNPIDLSAPADGVLVKFSADVSSESRARSLRAAGLRENANSSFNLVPGLTIASVEPGQTVQQTLDAILADSTNVAYAEPNYILTASVVPNDPSYAQEYGLAKISAPQAWDAQTGANTVVAVIDTGVDYNHPDLAANIWVNTREIAGNGTDDDGNGFVDDVRGWDFVQNDANPMDLNDHGTHVAGVIAGVGNNGVGISGVNWKAKIMPVRFMDAKGSGSTANAIRALDYAVANGARISNSSWGGPQFSQALYDAIQSANSRGHVFVAAAGNAAANNDSVPEYPSSYNLPNIISVAATDSRDALASFSNFGRVAVDVAAPGVSIYSTVRNGLYKNLSGTSMAAPFVTGLGTLLLAQNPNLTVSEIVKAINSAATVDTLTVLNGKVASGGRINAFKALTSVGASAPGAVVPPVVPVVVNPNPNPTPPQTATPVTTPPATGTNPTPVTPPGNVPPVSISVSPASLQVAVGSAQQFTATGGTAPYTWAVSNASVGTIVASTGSFSARAVGTVKITATDSTLKASAPVTVSVAPMAIAPGNVTQLRLSNKVVFTVMGGTPPFTWSSNSPGVAGVQGSGTGSQNGVLNLLAGGSFTLTATDSFGVSASVGPIAALDANQAAISVAPAAMNLTAGGTGQLFVSGGTSPFTWSSTSTGVASVNAGGLVVGNSSGFATIRVVDALNKSASANVSVTAVGAGTGTTPGTGNTPGAGTGSSLRTDVPSVVLAPGGSRQISATGGVPPYSWSSSSPSIVTSTNQGLVTAGQTGGSAFITVTDPAGGRASVAVEVRLVQIGAASGTLRTGTSLQLQAFGSNATPFSWRVDNTVFGTVTQSGALTGGSPGTLVVRVTDRDGVEGAASFAVTP